MKLSCNYCLLIFWDFFLMLQNFQTWENFGLIFYFRFKGEVFVGLLALVLVCLFIFWVVCLFSQLWQKLRNREVQVPLEVKRVCNDKWELCPMKSVLKSPNKRTQNVFRKKKKIFMKKSLYEFSMLITTFSMTSQKALVLLKILYLKLPMENVVDMNVFPKIYDLMKWELGGNSDFSLYKSHHYFWKTALHVSDRQIFLF